MRSVNGYPGPVAQALRGYKDDVRRLKAAIAEHQRTAERRIADATEELRRTEVLITALEGYRYSGLAAGR